MMSVYVPFRNRQLLIYQRSPNEHLSVALSNSDITMMFYDVEYAGCIFIRIFVNLNVI